MPTNRRRFLTRLAAAVGALATLPDRVLAADAPAARGRIPDPPPGLPGQDFWEELRGEFLIPRDEAFFNTGTLGSSPRVVLDAVVEHMTHVDRDIAHWDYKAGHETYFTGYYPETGVREKLARLLGADVEEVALRQNATFGMNFLANGLDLWPGDEVLVMEGAHPGDHDLAGRRADRRAAPGRAVAAREGARSQHGRRHGSQAMLSHLQLAARGRPHAGNGAAHGRRRVRLVTRRRPTRRGRGST